MITRDEVREALEDIQKTYVPIYDAINKSTIVGYRRMTNKEWLATLSAEDFYKEFKKAEEDGKSWTSTSGYVIKWLDEERRADEHTD